MNEQRARPRAGTIRADRSFELEISTGKRFEFGKNWRNFLGLLDDERIRQAESSLEHMLGSGSLKGRSFLDVGCGSGLFSLAAMRLGASRVHSFDYDPQSVACAAGLRRRCFPQAASWKIDRGSVLDEEYLRALGQWDIVYSWGVLHHTGNMWKALGNVLPLVAPGGLLFVSIYNDQGATSRRWRAVKSLYNGSVLGRAAVTSIYFSYHVLRGFLVDLLRFRNPRDRYRKYAETRGMSLLHDWRDWLGGYPFEVAKPDEMIAFCLQKGFVLLRLKTCGGGRGCNEYLFGNGILPGSPDGVKPQ